MCFLKSISDDVQFAQIKFYRQAKTERLVLSSFLGCMAAVLQAAGGISINYTKVRPFRIKTKRPSLFLILVHTNL